MYAFVQISAKTELVLLFNSVSVMTYIVFYLVNCHSRWLRRQHATCTHAFSFNAANSCTLAGLIIYNHFVSLSTRVLGNSTHLFTIRTDLCRQYLRNTLNLCRVIGNSSRFTDSNRFNQPASRSAYQILICLMNMVEDVMGFIKFCQHTANPINLVHQYLLNRQYIMTQLKRVLD